MKRTSQQQFEMLVTFMEEHGDLCKPYKTPKGRLTNLNRWEELTSLLNSDASGDTKTSEKWKKVWSDFKNNSKKKAARLHRAAGGTGGGPAIYSKLTDLENRALSLIGVEAATGLPVAEAGFSQEVNFGVPMEIESVETQESQERNTETPQFQVQLVDVEVHDVAAGQSSREHPILNIPSTVPSCAATSPTITVVEIIQDNIRPYNSPSQAGQTPSPRRTTPRRTTPRQTTPRRVTPRRATRARGDRQRQQLPTHTSEAADHFLRSDADWSQLRSQQHQYIMEMRREQNRLREMELHIQREWQNMGNQIIKLIEKAVDKYCNIHQ